MNHRIDRRFSLAAAGMVLAAVALLFSLAPGPTATVSSPNGTEVGASLSAGSNDNAAPGSCTIFTVSKDDTVFFGNTEDWTNRNTYVWSREGQNAGYGAVFFGFDDLYPQGGVNEMGLAYDVNGLPGMRLNPHPERRPAPDKFGHHLLATNATVDEAVAYILSLSWGPSFGGQFHLADASGDAAVVSAGLDGDLVVTRKGDGPGHLVSTNFNLAVPEVGTYPCRRYDQATKMLDQLMGSDRLAVDQVVQILDAVHQEGIEFNTVYANTFDLSRGVIYLYHGYQFDEALTLDVSTAIGRFTEPTPIWTLFSPETVQANQSAYQRYVDRVARAKSAGTVWLVLVAVSLPIQLWYAVKRRQEAWHERLAWIVGTLFFGPISLAVQRIRRPVSAAGTEQVAGWRRALGAALVWSSGYAFAWLLAFPYFAVMESDVGRLELFAGLYVMPLLVGVLLLRGVPYAARLGGSYGRGLWRLAILEWTAHNLISGGMIAVFFFLLVSWFPNGIQLDPLVWLAFSLSSLAGALAALPFKAWLVYRGVALWPWPASADAEDRLPVALNLRAGWPVLAFSLTFLAAMVQLFVLRPGLV